MNPDRPDIVNPLEVTKPRPAFGISLLRLERCEEQPEMAGLEEALQPWGALPRS